MSVYVDAPVYRYRRMWMCHMLADAPSELHAMADKIGVARRWYQLDSSTPHYDVCKTKRALAVAAGAIETDRQGVVRLIRKIRMEISQQTTEGQAWLAEHWGQRVVVGAGI